MLEPFENETQPQFAIRFHESMADEIPDTVKRNRACFEAWEQAGGEDPTIRELVESRFTPDQYKRLRNVALFHEHEVPEQEIDGKKIPAQKYGRDELAEMVEGMNDRILDHDEFSPITRGHTEQKSDGKPGDRRMPEVLGFAGPYRLGMIGRKQPRWAIFGDEYHTADAVSELKKRVGRSPEVWRYARMRDRFFYPIATLGEEMPRLNLPPAHYSRRSADESPVFVECYQATFPGGSNAFVPSFNASTDGRKPMADQYSAGGAQGSGGTPLTNMTLEEFIEALMETQPLQFVFGLMRQSGQSGQPNPAIPNQIPPDPNAMGGGSPAGPAAGPAGGDPSAQPAPPSPADPSAGQVPAASPQGAALPAVTPPGLNQQKDKDNYSRGTLEALQEQLELSRTKISELSEKLNQANARISQIDSEKTRLDRYSRLEKLSSDYLLDPEKELERTASYSPEQFEAHCQIITDSYQRSLANIPDFAALSDGVPIVPGGGPSKDSKSLNEKDVRIIEKYCIAHDCSYNEGKEVYLRERSLSS
jgi:hypothetical protein